jgi:O-antigen/teichoic acid export membrane protein
MLKSMLILMRGTVAAQGIGFAVLPLLTRLFTPADFGVLQLYQSIMAVLMVIATFRFEIAILRAETAEELKAVLILCAIINLLISILIFVIAVILYLTDCKFGATYPSYLIWCLPIAFLINGTMQYVTYWLTRDKAFGQSSNGKIAQAMGYVSAASATGLVNSSGIGLLAADIVSKLFSLIYSANWCRNKWQNLGLFPSWPRIKAIAWKFHEFPFVAVPGGLLNCFGGIMTPVMIYATFSANVSGQFGLVERSLTLPIGIIIVSVSQVFSAQVSEALRQNSSEGLRLFHRYAIFLFAVGIVPTIILAFAAPTLFKLLFGPQWALAGQFAAIIAPAYCLMLVSGGTNMILMLLGMQKMQIAWEIGRLAAMAGFWAFAQQQHWSATQAVFGHTIILAITSLSFLVLAEYGIRLHAKRNAENTEPNEDHIMTRAEL